MIKWKLDDHAWDIKMLKFGRLEVMQNLILFIYYFIFKGKYLDVWWSISIFKGL